MQLVKPKWYSHCPRKAYTLRGFEQKVMPRLMRDLHISKKEAEKLRRLYFPRGIMSHIDKTGAYRNTASTALAASWARTGRVGSSISF